MPSLRSFKAFWSSLISCDKSNIVLLFIGYSSAAPSPMFEASDSESESSELVETSVTLGYGVLDLLPIIALCYRTFLLIVVNILIAFSGS